MRIAQLTENLMAADAISDNVLALHAALRQGGFEPLLFAAHDLLHPEGIRVGRAGDMDRELRPTDLLLYQYSIGSPLTDWFLQQRCRKAIVYQNITPPEYLQPYDASLADAARLGREKLAAMVDAVDFAFASSEYSAGELRALGYGDVTVLPVLLDFDRCAVEPDAALTKRLRDGKKNILFVGRKAPNKCIEDLLLSADYYRTASGRDCRLVLCGDDSMGAYCAKLRALMESLSVEVLWLGRVSQRELNACYRESHLFLCMSEHEGFCVPLVESMAHDLPVLAYEAAAVPETLGGSGICFTRKDLPALAAVMDSLLYDEKLRASVIAGQRQRLNTFTPRRVCRILCTALERHVT